MAINYGDKIMMMMMKKKKTMEKLLLISMLIVFLSGEVVNGKQNCFCECMKRCIPLEKIGTLDCPKQCNLSCKAIGFPWKPRKGVQYCKNLY